MHSETPTSSATISSRDGGFGVKGHLAARRGLRHPVFKTLMSLTVSYPARSIGGISGASARGLRRRLRDSRRPRRPDGPRSAWSACGIPFARGSRSRVSGSGSCTSRSSRVSDNSTWSSSNTSCRDRRIWSALSIRVWRRLGCGSRSARARRLSKSPNSLIRRAAVLIPMPGAPGTLSTLSPANACTSTTRSGPTPNLASTPLTVDADVLHRVEHFHPVADQLHHVLVGRDDRAPSARPRAPGGHRWR